MLSGHEKAQLLLSMLGDRATAVLSLLSPENATFLTSTIGDSPKASPAAISSLISEVMDRVKVVRRENASSIAVPVSNGSGLGSFLGDGGDSMFSSSQDDTALSSGLSFGSDTTNDELDSDLPSTDAPSGPKMRSPESIAGLLMKEKPQIAAFILSKLDESLRESIVDSMSYEFRDVIQRLKVDAVPLSDAVFNRIYDSIVLAPNEPAVDEDSIESGPFSSGGLFG